MNELARIAGGILNWRGLLLGVTLAGMVLLAGWFTARSKKTRRKRPGQYLLYTVPTRTAAACRDLLSHKNIYDSFAYTQQPAPDGGSYFTLTHHNPTGQTLATVFLLRFEAESPARFSLSFVRDVFGAKEPVMPEALLDEFFAQKLDAVRLREEPV